MAIFSERLNELLEDKNISPEQLSKAMGVSLPTVYEWKAGNQIFYSNLLKLCQYLKCSIDFIAGRSEKELDFIAQTPPPFNIAIRAIMEKRNISTYRLRKDTRYDGSYFVRWDKGAEPYLDTLIELADYFDCTIDVLVGREK